MTFDFFFRTVFQLKVKMCPKPWSKHWERPQFAIQGIRFDLCMTPKQMEFVQKKYAKPWEEYDMLKEYDTSKLEEQILAEVQQEMNKWRPSFFSVWTCAQSNKDRKNSFSGFF